MPSLLRMPGVSADSDEAVLESWSTTSGAEVHAGDTVASVETEKAVVDIEVDRDGTVHALLAEDGAIVAVGDPIAILLAPGESSEEGDALLAELLGEPVSPAPGSDSQSTPVAATPPPPEPAPAPEGTAVAAPDPHAPEPAPEGASPPEGRRLFASPLARRMAKQGDLDLAQIHGSGPGGRIVRKDVEEAIAARAASEAATARVPQEPVLQPQAAEPQAVTPAAGGVATPHNKLRRLVASRLQESKRNAPHFYLKATYSIDALLELRARINAASSVRVSVNDFFVKAAGRALVDVPELNVVWSQDAVHEFATADVSVAVASERGLVTPVIRDVGSLSLTGVSVAVKDAVERANAGRLQQSELEGGTLSVTNLGMFGVEEFSAIINPPQTSILAIGAARREPVVVGDEVGIATRVTVTLSVDHRPVDGVVAARWLARLRELVEDPLQIVV